MTLVADPVRPTWTTRDGVVLAGRRWGPRGDTGRDVAVVLAHGFSATCDDVHVCQVANALAMRGFGVVAYDARGHGASGGVSTLGDDEQHDIGAAIGAASMVAERVVVMGAAMGAIAALRHAATSRPDIDVVLLGCPARWQIPRSAAGIAAVGLTRTAVGRRIARRRLRVHVAPRWTKPKPPIELVRALRGRVAILHGARDRVVPARAAYELRAAASTDARLDVVAGLGHGYAPEAIGPLLAAVEWTIEEPARTR